MNVAPVTSETTTLRLKALRSSRLQDPLLSTKITIASPVIAV